METKFIAKELIENKEWIVQMLDKIKDGKSNVYVLVTADEKICVCSEIYLAEFITSNPSISFIACTKACETAQNAANRIISAALKIPPLSENGTLFICGNETPQDEKVFACKLPYTEDEPIF